MSDKTFERSLTALSIIALLWMVLGSIFFYWVLGIAGVIIIGLVVWIAGGGTLLHFWGKKYMSRVV
jgi:hypothetical protein